MVFLEDVADPLKCGRGPLACWPLLIKVFGSCVYRGLRKAGSLEEWVNQIRIDTILSAWLSVFQGVRSNTLISLEGIEKCCGSGLSSASKKCRIWIGRGEGDEPV